MKAHPQQLFDRFGVGVLYEAKKKSLLSFKHFLLSRSEQIHSAKAQMLFILRLLGVLQANFRMALEWASDPGVLLLRGILSQAEKL